MIPHYQCIWVRIPVAVNVPEKGAFYIVFTRPRSLKLKEYYGKSSLYGGSKSETKM